MFGGIVDAISSVGKAITAPVAGVIGAGLNFLGGTQQNQSAWDISQAANASSAEQAANQMAFQERMRSTQYQGGAGTPTGAAGTVYTAPVRNVLGEAVNAYLAATQNDADVALKQTAASNTSAQTIKVEADTIKTAAEIGKVLEDTKVSTQTYKNMQEALNKLIAEISQIKASTGLTSATTKNVQENIAPSVDPYWYRDLKKGISSARDFVDKLKYKGVSVLPNFGGSKK
jgi:hypothetical protein